MLRDLKAFLVSNAKRSEQLRQQMKERGTPLGMTFTPVAVGVGDTVRDMSSEIQEVTDAIERALEAEKTTDKAIALLQAALGLGKAGLDAYSLVQPVAAVAEGGAGVGPMAAAAGAEGGGTAMAMGGEVAASASGAPLQMAEIAKKVASESSEGEAAASEETASSAQEAAQEPKRGAGETRTGVKRQNRKDWKKLVQSWDEAGFGDAISPSNRELIAAGKVPIVDEAWCRYFPGDRALMGEKISMHHIGGSQLTVPLPKSRHHDAHMPGGFRKNPGGPGTTGSRETTSNERYA